MSESTKEKNTQGITNPIPVYLTIPGADKAVERILQSVCLKRLFTVEETAAYLGRGVDSVREMIWRREIPVCQKGQRGKIWIDIRDLEAWITEHKHMAGEK